jgi:Family of unknown function (DUF6476)
VTDETNMSAEVDPKSTATYRGLKVAVISLGVLLLLAFLLVVVGIGMRMSGHAPGQSTTPGSYGLPQGAKILSLQVANNRLIMEVQEQDVNRVLIFSTDDGHLIGQIAPQDRQ